MSNSGQPEPNSKYTWREASYQGLPKRPPQERLSDLLEIYGIYDEATAREQASRCIQCPNPSCVTGCPLCNPIPEWMALTAEGRFLEAAAALGSATNLAEICVRLCPKERLCEASCVLSAVSDPVAIGDIEQFLTEYAKAHGHADLSTPPPNGLRVAVVGSGPGGLACADALVGRGYAVTIFDSSLLPGGLLTQGMAGFKLEKSIVQRRIEILEKRGVVFRLGMTPGKELSLDDLRAQFDAVYLGFDSRQARPLEIPGAELEGVLQGMTLLIQKTTPLPFDLPRIDVTGQRVVVIGGGDSAMDCLRVAIRSGASEAIGVYRRDPADMPATPHDYQNALEEGARFVFNAAPVAVLGDSTGKVRALRAVQTESREAEAGGRRSLSTLPGTEFDIEASWVIAALGFNPLPCIHSGDFAALAINEWGGVLVDECQMTNLEGVYAGGDIVRGPCLALQEVRDARRAADSIQTRHAEHL